MRSAACARWFCIKLRWTSEAGTPGFVTPAQAGVQAISGSLDSRLRGNDGGELTLGRIAPNCIHHLPDGKLTSTLDRSGFPAKHRSHTASTAGCPRSLNIHHGIGVISEGCNHLARQQGPAPAAIHNAPPHHPWSLHRDRAPQHSGIVAQDDWRPAQLPEGVT